VICALGRVDDASVVADGALQRQRGLLRMDAARRGEDEKARQAGDAEARDQDAQPST
jgi:hypothetical protein